MIQRSNSVQIVETSQTDASLSQDTQNPKPRVKTRRFRPPRFRRKPKEIKLVHLLPNALTSLNVACGISAILLGVDGQYELSAILILLAAFFDMIDGKVARFMGLDSPFGVQLDSLADVISFGVAPPVLMHTILYHAYDKLGLSLVLIYTLCTALRLARFNVQTIQNEKPKHFVGLPCPAPACFIAALVLVLLDGSMREAGKLVLPLTLDFFGYPIPIAHPILQTGFHILFVALSCLMVSTIPYPDFPSWQVEKKNIYQHTVFMVLILCVAFLIIKFVILACAAAFILSGPAKLISEMYNAPVKDFPPEEKETHSTDMTLRNEDS